MLSWTSSYELEGLTFFSIELLIRGGKIRNFIYFFYIFFYYFNFFYFQVTNSKLKNKKLLFELLTWS